MRITADPNLPSGLWFGIPAQPDRINTMDHYTKSPLDRKLDELTREVHGLVEREDVLTRRVGALALELKRIQARLPYVEVDVGGDREPSGRIH